MNTNHQFDRWIRKIFGMIAIFGILLTLFSEPALARVTTQNHRGGVGNPSYTKSTKSFTHSPVRTGNSGYVGKKVGLVAHENRSSSPDNGSYSENNDENNVSSESSDGSDHLDNSDTSEKNNPSDTNDADSMPEDSGPSEDVGSYSDSSDESSDDPASSKSESGSYDYEVSTVPTYSDTEASGGTIQKETPTMPEWNLIANSDFESSLVGSGSTDIPSGWLSGGWGTNSASYKYPVAGVDGSKAVEISVPTWTDGDAKWYFQDVPVTPGQSYTFSDQYKSNTKTSLTIRYTSASGTVSYAVIGSALNVAPDWTTASGVFTVPAWAVKMTVFHTISSTGTLDIDNASLRLSGASAGSTTTASTTTSTWVANAGLDGFTTGMVSLTFDDGWGSQYDNAVPILNAAGIKGTFYIVTNDMKAVTDYQSGTTDSTIGLPQVADLYSAGHEIDAHTRTHPSLITLSADQSSEEISGSIQDLRDAGISPVNTFAYPFGDYNDAVVQEVKNAGFIGARWVEDGYNSKNTNKYGLLVHNIRNATTPEEVQSWIKTAMDTHTWLILVFHQIDNQNSEYGTTPEKFKSLVDYLSQNKITTVTMDQGIGMMDQTTDRLTSNP